jgi:hypothetical protein
MTKKNPVNMVEHRKKEKCYKTFLNELLASEKTSYSKKLGGALQAILGRGLYSFHQLKASTLTNGRKTW